MKKGKMFKKSISCLLAALMIIASMPFSAISASAATGTLSAKSYQIVSGGTTNRWEKSQFNIVNDQEADNTSIGIIEYDISSLKGMVINSASLNFTIDSYNDDSQGLVFYYSNRLTNVTLSNGFTTDKTLTYGAGTVANESAASRYGFSTGNVLAYGSVNTSAQTSDIKTQLQTIVDSGATSFYVFIMQKTAGGQHANRLDGASTNDGWTDTKIKPTNVTINANYDVDNRPVTLAQAKAKLNSFNYNSFETQRGKWYDNSNNVLSMPSGTYSNLLYAGDSNADNGSFTGNGTGTIGYLRYQQSVFLYDDQNTPTAPIMVVYGYNDSGTRYVGAITLSDNRNNSLKLVDYWKCSRRDNYGNNWDYPNVWAQNGRDNINPSYDYNNPSTTGAQIANSGFLNNWNVVPGMANKMYYDGKMSDTTYSQDIQLTVDFYQGGSSNNTLSIHDTITGNKKCYVVNYKVVLEKIKQAKTDINTVKDEYSEKTKSAYAKALYDLVTFDPTSLSFSDSTLDRDVGTAGDKIKTLIKNYDNAYKNLSIDYTFKKVDGSTTTVPAKNADEAYSHKPANTFDDCEKLSNTQHTKYTYTWPTSPNGNVFTEEKKGVTENHDFKNSNTCACGAEVDDASFEAACTEAVQTIHFSGTTYDGTTINNYNAVYTQMQDERKNGKFLCQDDFDEATCKILYAKTLLKQQQGKVTLKVYAPNGNEIPNEGYESTKNCGEEITIAPKTEQNIYKWVISEKDGAESVIYGQPNISYVVTGDATVKAYCNEAQLADKKYTKVTFLVGGRVSDIKYVEADKTLKTSDANKLQFPFFTTGEWSRASVEGKADVPSVTVTADLEPVDSDKCGVHFPGTVEPIPMAYDTKVDVKEYPNYSSDSNIVYALSKSTSPNDIIAYMHGTVFYVPARKDVYVLKLNKNENPIKTKVNIVGTFTSVDDKNKYVGFNCKFSLAKDCTPIEWGITFIPILPSDRPTTTPEKSNVFRVKKLSKENEYTATLSLPKTSTKYSAVKAKAYLKYRDASNNIQVIYGDDEYTQAFDTTNKFGITQ